MFQNCESYLKQTIFEFFLTLISILTILTDRFIPPPVRYVLVESWPVAAPFTLNAGHFGSLEKWNRIWNKKKLIKLCGMEWKWNENKFRKFHENIWDENNYKFQHFLMNRTNCLFIIHNKKTFYYRTLPCEMWILEYWNFFLLKYWVEWNGMECGMRKTSWNGMIENCCGMKMEFEFSRFWTTTQKHCPTK
jgi:hypothetical protein